MLSFELKRQFDTLADALDLLGEGTFRVRAYRRAARMMTEISEHDLHTFDEKQLEALPGIGEGIAKKILEYRSTGKITLLENTKAKIPRGLFGLLLIPTLGPKSIRKMWLKLNVTDFDSLVRSIDDGTLTQLFGFGPKKVENIRNSLHQSKKSQGRIPLAMAIPIANKMATALAACPEVSRIDIAGSLRRQRPVIGDIDLLAESLHPKKVIDCFTRLPNVIDILAKGETKASVRIEDEGRQVDLRVVAPHSFGSALQYFTGSKEHNILLRQIAQKKGLKLSEYGVFRGSEHIAGETEESVYAALGQKMVPPPQRFGKNELTGKNTDS